MYINIYRDIHIIYITKQIIYSDNHPLFLVRFIINTSLQSPGNLLGIDG